MCHFESRRVIANGEETHRKQTPLHSSCAGWRPWRPRHISRRCQTINCNHTSQLNYLPCRKQTNCTALQTFSRDSANPAPPSARDRTESRALVRRPRRPAWSDVNANSQKTSELIHNPDHRWLSLTPSIQKKKPHCLSMLHGEDETLHEKKKNPSRRF